MDVRRKYVIALLAVEIGLFILNLGGRDLWESDETRYAVIARERKETGNWILPHLNGEVYAEKPPLSFWLVNLSTFFEVLNSSQRVFVVIYPEALNHLKKETGIELSPLEQMTVANWKYALISNR